MRQLALTILILGMLGLMALIAVYFVSSEQGAFAVFSGAGIHEWVHDGRHLLGFPCH